MLAATISLVSVTGVGVVGAFLRFIFHFGKKAGELSSALVDATRAIEHLATNVDKMNTTLNDHEVRLSKLEVK